MRIRIRSVPLAALLAIAALAGCASPAQESTSPTTTTTTPSNANGAPATHDVVLLSAEAEVNETAGVPGDYFQPSVIVVNRGDTVNLHFFNTEPVDEGAQHSFDLEAFNVSEVVDPNSWANVTFVASKAGVFDYSCRFHEPTMRGQLVVLG